MKQKRIGKKAVSWLLTLVMLIGLLPMPTASAAESSVGGTVDSSQIWDAGTEFTSSVTITGGDSADNAITITVNDTVSLTQTITVSSGYVVFTGGGMLMRGVTKNLITVNSIANLTLENITIDGNKENDTYATNAGGSLVCNSGTLTMNDGATLQNNTATFPGGVNISNGTFTMNGGSITGNSTALWGGGVFADGTFTMNGGSITGNSAGSQGGGVYVNGGTFTMNGGSITGNSAGSNGGGVYISSGTATLGDAGKTVTITGNTNSTSGAVENLYLGSGKTVTLGAMAADSSIGVTTVATPAAGTPVAFTNANADYENYAQYFFPDSDAYLVEYNSTSNVLQLAVDTTEHIYVSSSGSDDNAGTKASPYATLSKAFTVINGKRSDTAPVTVHVMSDLEMTSVAELNNANKAVTLTSNGDSIYTVKRGDKGDLITIGSGSNLTLENITIDGDKQGSFSDSEGALVLVDYGALTVKTGATLQNNARKPNTAHGSGVHINSGTLTMTGGEIRNNDSRYGGGVTAYPGTFTMTGGSITGNSAIESGGGVHLDKGGTFTMTGGSITGNSCGGGYYGGGVNVGYGGEAENRIAATLGGENATAITIKDNKCGTTANNNLSISQSDYATVTLGDLASGSSIGISARKPPTTADAPVTLATSTTAISDGAMEYFFSDSTEYRLLRSGDSLSLLLATLPAPNLEFENPGTITYDGAKVTVGTRGTSSDLIYNIDDSSVSLQSTKWYEDVGGTYNGNGSTTAPTNAGTYWLVLTTRKVENQYSKGIFEKQFTISPKEISMTGAAVTTKEYDGTDAATITPGELDGVLDADRDQVSVKESSIAGTFTDGADVGTNKSVQINEGQNFTLEGDRASNYTLTQPTGLTGEITKKPVTLTIVAASRPYEKDNVTVDLTGATITVNDKVNNDEVTANLTGMTGTMDDDAKGTGKTVHLTNGTASLTGDKAGNYTLTQPTTATVDITSATWENKTATVSERPDVEKTVELAALIAPGGELGAPSESGSMLFKCVVDGDKLVFKIKTDAAENETTTVTIPVTNATNYDDYNITVTITALASISQEVLNAITGHIGTYDGAPHNAVVTGGAVTGDYTLTYSNSENGEYNSTMPTVTNAGSKTVWVKVSRPGYADATKSVNAEVAAKSLSGEGVTTITLGTQATYDGNSHNVEITSVAVDGITAELVKDTDYEIISGGSATNVEDTTLEITGRGNFTGTKTVSWKLEKAETTVDYFTLPDLSEAKTYSGSSISVTAPTPADGKTGLGAVTVYYEGSSTTNYSKDTQAPTNAGTYTVTFDVAEGTNYKAVNGLTIDTLTIKPKEVTVTAVDKTAMVGGSVPSLDNPVKDKDYTVEGLVGSDALTGHSVKLAYASAPDMSQAVEYRIVPSAATENTNTNYTIRYVDGKLIVGGIVLPGKNQNVTTDDVILRPDTDADVRENTGDGGGYHVGTPGGSVVLPGADQDKSTTGDNVTVTVTGEFDVKNDGTVILPSGGSATVGDKTVTGPATIKPDGTVERPSSGGGGGGSSSGGGGGSSSTTYPPTVKDPDHGDVTVSPKNPSKGETVIIRPDPDKGYEVDDVVVTKPDGTKVPVKDRGDGTWSYTQPGSKVTVKVTFRKIESNTYDQCKHGKGCPLWPFEDVTSDAWYHDGVHYCLDNGLMNGKSDTIFDPNGTTTRGQIVAILWRLEGQPKVGAASYSDVTAGKYYTEAVAWAAANGIVTGYNDGTFKPNTPITREQMAAILWRYCKYKGIDVSVGEDTNILSYNDATTVAEYAVSALQWATSAGVISGKQGDILDPKGSATRAQVATILMRFCVNIVNK